MQKMPVAQLISMFDGEVHPIREKTCLIGRQSGENVITVDESIISREHAVIRFEDNHYLLRDNGSKNGTFLNGKRLEPGICHKLKHEDVIEFSKLKYVFRFKPQEESHMQIKGFEGKIEISGGQKKLVITLSKEKIAAYQQKMQENNTIKGLLNAACLDAGDRILLYYEIDGLKKFENMVLKQEMQEKEILKILLQITETMRGLVRYLLPEENLVLEPGMIFIDGAGLAKLICLPLAEKQETPGLEQTLPGLVLFALPRLAKKLVVSGEEIDSPTQLRRLLTERLETIKQEEDHPPQKIDSIKDVAKKECGSKSKTGFGCHVSKPAGILLFQVPVLLLIAGIYVLHLLKPIDFLGFCIITAALDVWIVKTLKKPKEESV